METPLDGRTKVCSKCSGHMTKMAATLIYSEKKHSRCSPDLEGWWTWDLVCSRLVMWGLLYIYSSRLNSSSNRDYPCVIVKDILTTIVSCHNRARRFEMNASELKICECHIVPNREPRSWCSRQIDTISLARSGHSCPNVCDRIWTRDQIVSPIYCPIVIISHPIDRLPSLRI